MNSLKEIILRQEAELSKIQREAKLKYRTSNPHELRVQGDSGVQQFEDKKAVAFQIDTTRDTLKYLNLLKDTVTFVANNDELEFQPLIQEDETE